MARPPRFERGLSDFKGRRVNQLHYGRVWRLRGGAEGLASFFSTSPPRNLMCCLCPRNRNIVALPYPTFGSAISLILFHCLWVKQLSRWRFSFSTSPKGGRDCSKSEVHHVMPYLHENPNRRLGLSGEIRTPGLLSPGQARCPLRNTQTKTAFHFDRSGVTCRAITFTPKGPIQFARSMGWQFI